MTDMTTNADEATRLRNEMIDELRNQGDITSPEVEAVMRKVPRDRFTPPGLALAEVYDPWSAVITKTSAHGVQTSSVSAPQVQGFMLEQAKIKPGMNVLEIGSGGLNAAYLAELVGPEGSVTTVDIDPEVTERAERLLLENGYDRVRVVTADAAEPVPGLGVADVILVTVGAWDIPPAWTHQLNPQGRLVVPLRTRGLTRSVAFVLDGDHLESESAKVCGFVPMQGATEHHEQLLLVAGTEEIGLRFDDGVPIKPSQLDDAVTTPRIETWTGVTIGRREPLATLQMHLAITVPGFCIMSVDAEKDSGIVAPTKLGFSLAAVSDDSFAYLVHRPSGDTDVEYGVHALGRHAQQLADNLTESLRDWAAHRRGGPVPVIRAYPASTPDDQIVGDRVIDKVHSRISLSWPAV
ncbi:MULTISPECIES: methyltransferase, FxLD system [unclassified Streptomyces]|uniref:methyltransferase, FxLD system n=1 Tax=unclassified Streptomyces TaxID=2593676 RepID=UPI000DBA2A6F|nr:MULTISPECIES: methyltransferase, FxLD system [unclassified Streptomyces]MYT68322.1 methyltransferase, FxLD system [Streptomyces sp. SID8367]RAJ76958.1 protein-L-isoaspartate(D-aspartate) O-methyltransferase [Streptomyces sp. PsTaAH-137]